MKQLKTSGIKLVITMALRKEVPKEWFEYKNVPVHTLAALKAGALKNVHGMLIVITGAGPNAGKEAACWIRDNVKPLFVANVGTCGIRNKSQSLGVWIAPASVADESGNSIALDKRMPLTHNEHVTSVDSLLSVRNVVDDMPVSHDVVDMECYAQAEVFAGSGITFHCLKFATDYSDAETVADFNMNLELFREEIKKLFSFIILPFTGGGQEGSNISVIIPVYNRENTIKRAVYSVLSQSVLPKEIIVVDDSSTDGTGDILKGYGDKISLIQLPETSGPSRARNTGIEHAKTEWIALLDSDDSWEEDKLREPDSISEKVSLLSDSTVR